MRANRLARSARERRAEQRFVIEGPLLIAEAVAAGVALEAVFVDETVEVPPEMAAFGLVTVAAGGLDRIGDVGTSQGLLAIAELPGSSSFSLEELVSGAGGSGPAVLVLHDVADPGNVGTLLRSAEAAGAGAVLCRGGADVWSPKVVRAAAGALFRLPVLAVDDPIGVLEGAGVVPVAALARGGRPYDQADLGGAVGIVIGSEAHGLPGSVLERCADTVTIPLVGPTESLNAAMAGTVLLFEALRQRRAAAPAAARRGDQTNWTSSSGQARVSAR